MYAVSGIKINVMKTSGKAIAVAFLQKSDVLAIIACGTAETFKRVNVRCVQRKWRLLT
jgi:hypothetical protein